MVIRGSKPRTLKSLLRLHKAMLIGQLIFAAVAFYLVYAVAFNSNFHYPDKVLQILAIALSAAGLYAGKFLFKKMVLNARQLQTAPKEKFAVYQSACILQWALAEGPVLLVTICFLLTGNYAFLALAVALIVVFATMAPSKLKIILYLQISEKEVAEL